VPTFAPNSLTWPRRARVEIRAEHRRRIWQSRCGRFRVVESRCLLGGEHTYAVRYYALRLEILADGRPFWEKLSDHRKRACAFAACEKESQELSVES